MLHFKWGDGRSVEWLDCISQSLSGSFLSRVLPIQDSTCGWGGDRLRDFRERNSRTKIQLLLLLDLLLVSHLHLLSADVQSPAPDLAASQKWETILLRLLCSLQSWSVWADMFSVWGPDISWIITSSSSLGQRSLPSSSPGYFQDTWDFIHVSNSQQSPSTAEKGTSSQYWALKELTHFYNRSILLFPKYQKNTLIWPLN